MQASRYRFPRLLFLVRKLQRANYEREMEVLDLLCDPARTGIDIGAKVGMYTYRIRALSSDVVAFEPNPLFNHLLNKVFRKRARIEPFAVSNVRGGATLRLPFDHDGSRQFGRATIDPTNQLVHHQIARVEELEVETRRLDDYELANVGFIKIDVEGHELSVLDGGVATIEKHKPNLLIECNGVQNPQGVTKLASWLHARDYDVRFIDGNVLRPIEEYELATHWEGRGIENFIGVHRSRTDVLERLTARVATRDPAVMARKLAHQ